MVLKSDCLLQQFWLLGVLMIFTTNVKSVRIVPLEEDIELSSANMRSTFPRPTRDAPAESNLRGGTKSQARFVNAHYPPSYAWNNLYPRVAGIHLFPAHPPFFYARFTITSGFSLPNSPGGPRQAFTSHFQTPGRRSPPQNMEYLRSFNGENKIREHVTSNKESVSRSGSLPNQPMRRPNSNDPRETHNHNMGCKSNLPVSYPQAQPLNTVAPEGSPNNANGLKGSVINAKNENPRLEAQLAYSPTGRGSAHTGGLKPFSSEEKERMVSAKPYVPTWLSGRRKRFRI